MADPNDFANRFYKTYSQALGVLNLERNELEVEDVELDEADYEGENEDIMRINPSDMVIEPVEDDE